MHKEHAFVLQTHSLLWTALVCASDGVCNKGIAEVDRKCKAASPAVTGKIMNRVCDDCLADAWAGLFYSGKCSTILNNDSDYMNENVLEKVYCK